MSGSLSKGHLDRAVLVILHVMVATIPLAMSNLTWAGFQAPFTYDQFDLVKVFLLRALVLLALGCWVWSLARGARLIRVSPILWVLAAFLLLAGLSSILSVHPPTALAGKYRRYEGLFTLLSYAAVFLLALQVMDTARRVRLLSCTLVASAVVVAGYGLAQFLGFDPISWGATSFELRRSFSTFGNPNLLAGFLIFPLALAPVLALSEERKHLRAGWWTAFGLFAACLLTTFTRSAWLAGGVTLAILTFGALRSRPCWGRLDSGFLVGSAAVLLALGLATSGSRNSVLNVTARLASFLALGEGSAKTRTEIWKAAWASMGDRPLIGHGLDTFRLLFPQFKTAEYVLAAGQTSVADNAHNYPLQIAIGAGIPAVIILFAFLGWLLWQAAGLAFRRETGVQTLVFAGFWAGAVGYLVHLMFAVSVAGGSFILWLALGLLLAPWARLLPLTFRSKPAAWAVAAIATAALALAFAGNLAFLAADHYFMSGQRSSRPFEHRLRDYDTAIRLNPWCDPYRSEVGYAHLRRASELIHLVSTSRGQDADVAAVVEQARQELGKGSAALRRAVSHSPLEYDNYLNLAVLYNQGSLLDRGYASKALGWTNRAIALAPLAAGAWYQSGLAHYRLGHRGEAVRHWRKAVAMDPNFPEPRMMLERLNR